MPHNLTPTTPTSQQALTACSRSARYFVGVDVGAVYLDVCLREEGLFSGGAVERFPNSPVGRNRLSRWLKKVDVAAVTCEATGKLERPLVRSLVQQGYVVHVLNPAQLVGFRKARGKIAKTDALDAELLSLFAEVMRPEARPLPDEGVLKLRDIVVRRRQLVADRVAEQNRAYRTDGSLLVRQINAHLRLLDRQVDALDVALKELLVAQPELQRKFDLLCTIPGIGKVAALTLVAEMPELGALSDKAVAALSGLAPMSNDSGIRFGRARLRGGRKAVRSALYMATMAARRCNIPIKVFYERLVSSGKPKLVALCAAMRKLLIIANHILASGLPWRVSPA